MTAVTEPAPSTVALLGTGIMGAAMARNLLHAGLPVRVWNRTRSSAEALAEDGAVVADTPAQATEQAQIMLTMLPDADAVAEVASAALASRPDIWVQSSTVGIEGCERLAALAAEHDVAFVDAPVLGTRQPAEEGQLRVLAAGPDDVLDRCQVLFDAIGASTLRLGDAGAASALKLVTNSWVLTLVEGVAEAFALAQGLGVDPSLLLRAIEGGPLDSPYAQLKGRAMIDGSFDQVSFPLRWASKDAQLMRSAAGDAGLDLPLIEAIAAALGRAVVEHGDLDLAATFLTSSPHEPSA